MSRENRSVSTRGDAGRGVQVRPRTGDPVDPPVGLGRRLVDAVIILIAWACDLVLAPLFTFDEPVGGSLLLRGTDQQVPVLLVVAVVTVMALALALRRRHSWPVFLTVLGISVGMALVLSFAQPMACLLVAVYAVASRGTLGRARLALVLTLAHVLLISWVVYTSFPDRHITDLLLPFALFSLLVGAAWGFARHDAGRVARTQDLTHEIEALAERAAHEERRRIARELHDILAHSVSAMMMQAAGARAMAGSLGRDEGADPRLASVEQALSTIETTGSQSMRELHRLLGALRQDEAAASSLDLDGVLSPSGQPGLADLDELVQTPRRSGLIVEVHRTGTAGRLDPSVGAAAYRVVQEALTNALKHSGQGAVVDVYVSWQDSEVMVQVRCRGCHDGDRPQTPNGGTGLRGLKERVGLAGGRFDSGWVGDEFVTTATLPTLPASTPS